MKFLMATAVYVLFAALLAWGILQATVFGKPAILIVVVMLYLAGLLGIGCLPKKSH